MAGVSLTLGGEVPTSTNLDIRDIARLVLGLNIEVVRGYPGAAPMFLAMQRHEIDGQVIGLQLDPRRSAASVERQTPASADPVRA